MIDLSPRPGVGRRPEATSPLIEAYRLIDLPLGSLAAGLAARATCAETVVRWMPYTCASSQTRPFGFLTGQQRLRLGGQSRGCTWRNPRTFGPRTSSNTTSVRTSPGLPIRVTRGFSVGLAWLPGRGAHRDRMHKRGDGRGDRGLPVRGPRLGSTGIQVADSAATTGASTSEPGAYAEPTVAGNQLGSHRNARLRQDPGRHRTSSDVRRED